MFHVFICDGLAYVSTYPCLRLSHILLGTTTTTPSNAGDNANQSSSNTQEDQSQATTTSAPAVDQPQDANVAAVMKPAAPATPSPTTQRRQAWAAGTQTHCEFHMRCLIHAFAKLGTTCHACHVVFFVPLVVSSFTRCVFTHVLGFYAPCYICALKWLYLCVCR